MTYKISTLNNFVGVSEPTFIGDTQIDGYIDGRPVLLRRLSNGTVMPAIGATLPTSMGTGVVLGTYEGGLLVDIFDFNDDYEFITADESDIYDASEMVSKLNACLERNFDSIPLLLQRICLKLSGKKRPIIKQLVVGVLFRCCRNRLFWRSNAQNGLLAEDI